MGLVALVVALIALLLVARVSQAPTLDSRTPPPVANQPDDTADSMTSETSGTESMTDSMTDDEPFFFISSFNADDETAQYWQQTEAGNITRLIDDGDYVLQVDERRTAATALFDAAYTYENLSVVFQGTLSEESASETSAMGIVFRYQDAQNYNVFAVDGMGQFSIWRFQDGVWFELRDLDDAWTADDAINPLGESNMIALNVYNDRITARVNGELMVLLEDDTFDGGGVGIYAASTAAGQTIARINTYAVQEASAPSMTDDMESSR
jgi:hypothetical protein